MVAVQQKADGPDYRGQSGLLQAGGTLVDLTLLCKAHYRMMAAIKGSSHGSVMSVNRPFNPHGEGGEGAGLLAELKCPGRTDAVGRQAEGKADAGLILHADPLEDAVGKDDRRCR